MLTLTNLLDPSNRSWLSDRSYHKLFEYIRSIFGQSVFENILVIFLYLVIKVSFDGVSIFDFFEKRWVADVWFEVALAEFPLFFLFDLILQDFSNTIYVDFGRFVLNFVSLIIPFCSSHFENLDI